MTSAFSIESRESTIVFNLPLSKRSSLIKIELAFGYNIYVPVDQSKRHNKSVTNERADQRAKTAERRNCTGR
jgi:hypothetical protein